MKHSIRQAKITLYLDVPTTYDKNHFISNNVEIRGDFKDNLDTIIYNK